MHAAAGGGVRRTAAALWIGPGVRRTAAAVWIGVVAGVVALAACTPKLHPSPPPPTIPDVTTSTSTTAPDFSSATLGSIVGATTLARLTITPGKATFTGTVVDDIGAPLPAATVELVRVSGDQTAVADVASRLDGTWTAQGIQGGAYRVRAWKAPDLAQSAPQIVFIGASDTQRLDLATVKVSTRTVQAAVTPNPPVVGAPAAVAVEVTGGVVGTDGLVRGQGLGGVVVDLIGEGAWVVIGNGERTTSAAGFALFQATCGAPGAQALSALVDNALAVELNVPPCAPVPLPTTAAPLATVPTSSTAATVSSAPASTSSTVRKGG